MPTLMGSLTKEGQVDLEETLADRDKRYNVNYKDKAKQREDIELPGIHEGICIFSNGKE